MHLRSISFLLLALYCFFTVSPHGIQAATTPIAGLTAAKPATTLPAATSSLANAQAAKTAAPLVCGKITSLQGLLQTNENSHGSAVALKELLKPIISRFKDLSAPEIETLLRGDPEAFNKALSSPLYANSYGIFIQNLRRLNVEANRLFSGMTQAGCLSPKELRSSKDFRTLTAVYFQQWLYSTATPLLRSTTRRLAPEYDDQYIIADQIPFTIMKSGIEDQCANQIAALQKLALYLAGAGEFDLSLFELSLFYGGELILKKLDDQGLGPVKESFLRDVAPIFLLTCDVSGVGRGMKSPSCAFLANHKDLLKVGIQNNGWSCGAVTSWDFKNGRLASFPIAATNGAQNCETADALALVDSFSSTVTNFGDCGTANRLYACPKMIGGKLAYPNLCHLCEVPANALDPTQFGEDLDAMGPTLGSVSQLCGQFGPQSPPGVGGAASHPIPPSIGCEITHESQQVCGSTPTNAGSQLSNALAGAPTGNDCPPGNGFQAPGGGRPIVNPGIGGLDSNTLRAKWAGKVFSQSEKALGHAVEPLAKEVFEEVLESSVKYSFKLSEVLPYVSGGLVRVGFLVGILTGTAFTTISLVFEPSSIASEGDASNIYPPWQGPPTQEMINQGTWQTNPGGSRDPSFERDLTSTRNGSNKSTGTVTVGIAGDANGDGKIDENEMKTDTDGDGTSDWEDPDPQDPKIKTDSDLPQNNSGSGKDDATAGDSPDEFSVSECTWYGKAMKSVGYCLNAQLSQAASALGMPQKSLPAGPTSPKDPVSNFPTDSDHGISAGGPDICYLSVGPTAPAGVQATAGSGGLTNPTGPGQYKPGTGQALPTKGGTVCTSTEPCPGGGKRTAPSCECPQQPVGSNGTVPLGTGGGLPTGGGGTPLAK